MFSDVCQGAVARCLRQVTERIDSESDSVTLLILGSYTVSRSVSHFNFRLGGLRFHRDFSGPVPQILTDPQVPPRDFYPFSTLAGSQPHPLPPPSPGPELDWSQWVGCPCQ